MEGYHATSVLSLGAGASSVDRALINASIGRMYALGANRTRRDGERFVTARIEKIARKIAGLNTPSRPAPPLGSWV